VGATGWLSRKAVSCWSWYSIEPGFSLAMIIQKMQFSEVECTNLSLSEVLFSNEVYHFRTLPFFDAIKRGKQGFSRASYSHDKVKSENIRVK
jgi:hypothetical protein